MDLREKAGDRSPLNADKPSGGGVLISVRATLPSCIINESSCNEEVSVRISIGKTAIVLCCIYLPPDASLARYSSHCDSVRKLVDTASPESKVIVIGDFNLKNTIWYRENENDLHLLPLQVRTPEETVIVDELTACALVQVCGIPNQNNRFLDLTFTNDDECCQ